MGTPGGWRGENRHRTKVTRCICWELFSAVDESTFGNIVSFSDFLIILFQREYRREYEEQVKGKALVDVDQTPAYLTARHASSLLSEVTE